MIKKNLFNIYNAETKMFDVVLDYQYIEYSLILNKHYS